MMHIFPLETARLMLRPFARRDLATLIAYRNQPAVARYQTWSSFSAEDAEAFFVQQDSLVFDTDETWFQIATERKLDAVLVGDVAVHVFDQGRQAELGATFDLAHQRQGYALEAVSRIIEVLFVTLRKHRIVATVDERNLPAQRLVERLGFRREGHYRENILFKGTWSDEYGYALLSREWWARHPGVPKAMDGG
jgi:RimJ/RimL family protein N-acetyltransferase